VSSAATEPAAPAAGKARPPETTRAVVIGAGPAGLATAACLGKAGVDFVLLEREQRVGSAWRRHYERLHLHTMRRFSSLPHHPFPADWPRYVPRAQVVEYLETYAEAMGVRPRFGEPVERAFRKGEGWEVETPSRVYRAPSLVIATGYTGEPHEPAWPGREDFQGEVLHSAAYQNGEPFRGRRVLVVGSGNSGAEIALCLWEHGAKVSMCIRGPIHVVPRDAFGMPAQLTGILLSKLPIRVADAIAGRVSRFATGDLSTWGIERPAYGPVTQVVRDGRVPLIDVGTIDLIKQGHIRVFPGVERFTTDSVRFVDGREEAFDAVLLATGYKARLDRFLDGAAGLTDSRGYPRWHGEEVPDAPGLYFTGFRNPLSGALREIALEARRVARAIASAGSPKRGED
jgi:cation diffusion facilitator CzcD-associated flavoprotein CzcO